MALGYAAPGVTELPDSPVGLNRPRGTLRECTAYTHRLVCDKSELEPPTLGATAAVMADFAESQTGLMHSRARPRTEAVQGFVGCCLGCRNVLSFDAKPIPGLGLLHRTHWGSPIGVGVAIGIGIGIESAHRSKQPAPYQSLMLTLKPIPTPTKHPSTGKCLL